MDPVGSLRSRRAAVVGLVVALLAIGPPSAGATALRGLDLDDLARRADHVVRGEVVERRAQWIGRRIATAVTVRVQHSWLGGKAPGERLTFWRLGGEADGYEMRVVGAPRFRVGEVAVLFLSRRRGRLYVAGMFQGRFRVQRRAGGALVVPPRAAARLIGSRRALRRPLPLADFAARITAALRRRPPR